MFIGNQQIYNFFENAVANGNLAQVYCFSGISQVGKRTLALELASKLLNVLPEKINIHPDFYYLNRGIDEKTEKERKEISVSQVRTLREFLQNQTWENGWRVVVIDESEFLNEESGNALLKSLEEPNEKTIFFLLTEDDGSLLPTIRSRAQVFQFSPVSEEEIAVGLQRSGCDQDQSSRISYLSSGRPGRALDFLNNEEKMKAWEEEVMRWRGLWQKPLHERLKILENIVSEKDETENKTKRLGQILNIWMEEGRRMLVESVNGLGGDQVTFAQVVDALSEAQVMLEQNINPKMVMEKIMLQF